MNNSHPRPLLPTLLAALAFVAINTQAARAQQPAPQQTSVAAALASSPAPAKGEPTAAAKQTPAAESVPSVPTAAARPAAGASGKCACESNDEPDNFTPSLEPAKAERAQLFASTSAASGPAVPELFPRVTVRDDQSTIASQQTGATQTQWTPLTSEEKMKRAARNAFLSPIGIGRTLVSSAITQYNEEDQPHKTRADKFADGATRFAINFSRRATRTLLGSGVYPILFKQDPRYDRAEEGKNFIVRAGHAVSRVFVQRGDSGKLQPGVSRWAGSLSASALSNIWERSTPGHDRIGADATFKRFANSFISDSINNLFVEFLPDIKKILGR